VERHPFDALSFIFGLLFIVVAMLGLTDLVELTWFDLRWIAPAVLVALGLVLVLTAGRGRGERQTAVGGGSDDHELDAVDADTR
jgi:hypothetical protein